MSPGWGWDYEVPSHIVEKMKPYDIPTREEIAAYFLAESCGLYDDTSDVNNFSADSNESIALSYVVGVSSFGLGFRPYHSSGIIVEHNNVKLILTSCYILGDGSKTPKVTLILCNQKEVSAHIEYIDAHHNLVFLRAEQLDAEPTAEFSCDIRTLGTSVRAVGRHYSGRFMVSFGTINNRRDHLESDDLMSSTSNISEWGIGGALVENSTGIVLGMNFFCKKGDTPFMPSNILIKCVKHFVENRVIRRPWLGLKVRSIDEVDIEEMDAIYRKFGTFDGIVVKEVTRDSPANFADFTRICVGDVIAACNNISITSPAQFAGVLFRSVESKRGNLIIDEKRDIAIKLTVKSVADGSIRAMVLPVRRFSPPVPNSWPVLPIPKISGEANLASSSRRSGK